MEENKKKSIFVMYPCQRCGREFETTRVMVSKCLKRNMRLWCQECRNSKITYVCKECGRDFTLSTINKKKVDTNFCVGCKRKHFWLKNYGVENVAQLAETTEKKKATRNERYGSYCSDETKKKISESNKIAASNPEVLEKRRKTCMERFGVPNNTMTQEGRDRAKRNFHSEEAYAKRLITYKEKYGGPSPFSSKEVREKSNDTKPERYGDIHYTNIDKRFQTCFEKYGCISPFGSPEVREKIKKVFQEKYGADSFLEAPESRQYYNGIWYNDLYFDSRAELDFYIKCLEEGKNIIREPTKLIYYFEGVEHHYYPDFEVDGELVEIKGRQFLKDDGTWQDPYDHSLDALFEAKRQCALANQVRIIYVC